MQVTDPERGNLDRDSNNLSDMEGLGINPDVAKEQALFLTLWNHVQHIFWNRFKVLLAQENEIIIGSTDAALLARLCRSYFLFQNAAYNLFTSRVTLIFDNFECLDVRGSEADLSGYFRRRFWIIAPEYLILPRHFVGPRAGRVLFLCSLQRIQNRVQIGQ